MDDIKEDIASMVAVESRESSPEFLWWEVNNLLTRRQVFTEAGLWARTTAAVVLRRGYGWGICNSFWIRGRKRYRVELSVAAYAMLRLCAELR
jgi:hypothetical protein